MRSFKKYLLFFIPVLLLFFAVPEPVTVSAASYPAKITKCQLVSSNKVKITATVSNTKAISSQKCYLFALSLSQSKITVTTKPVTSKKKAKKLTFTVTLDNTKKSSKMYSRFVLASKNKDGSYKIISNAKYISNPKKVAQYRYKFLTATSKKGLQISSQMLEDAIDLNVQHASLNIVFTEMIASDSEHNTTASIPYTYHGKTYWFRKSLINSYDAQLTALKENNVTVSAILLLGWRDDLSYLITPAGRQQGHSFYAWNTSGNKAREHLQASLAFLTSRYGSSSAEHGRILNWIIGNEVNSYNVYNYAGQKTLKQYAKIYANMFRMAYNTITSICANARVYISLDHLWNTHINGSFTAREMLDAFASTLKNQGNIRWNLAYHPYGSPLTEPRFWANINGQVTNSLTSPVINMANIDLLTSYIREKYGSKTRIILSEQGYTSVRHSSYGNMEAQKEQAAAIAYSYFLTESNDMIDSFIMNRHVDHQAEIDQGLDLGLWTTDTSSGLPEWAGSRKQSWQTFKYMDSNLAESVTADSLSVIGISQWSDVIPGFNKLLYSKNFYASSELKQVNTYQKAACVSSAWSIYGAASRGSKGETSLTVYHNNSRNRNSLWGVSQSFSQKVNFTSAPVFYTTIKVHGATAQKALIKIRFFSGNNILESERVINCDTAVPLGVSLGNWYYQKAVKKIQILVSPVSGNWTNDAYMTLTYPVRGM